MNTTSDNKSVIEDFHRRLNQGDHEGAAALAAEDLVNHAAIPEAQGRAGLVSIFGKLRAGFPDAVWHLEDLIAEGDRVVARIRMTGTNTGPIQMTRLPMSATGKPVETESVHVFRLAAGRIVETWAGRDDFGLLRQLGVQLKPS